MKNWFFYHFFFIQPSIINEPLLLNLSLGALLKFKFYFFKNLTFFILTVVKWGKMKLVWFFLENPKVESDFLGLSLYCLFTNQYRRKFRIYEGVKEEHIIHPHKSSRFTLIISLICSLTATSTFNFNNCQFQKRKKET